MKRRGFLKLFAGGTAVAFVAVNTPLSLIKPIPLADLNIREIEYYDGVNDVRHGRLDWCNGVKQYGVDYKISPQATQEQKDVNKLNALETLFKHIKGHNGSLEDSIKLEIPNNGGTLGGYLEVNEDLKRKYA